MTLFENAATAEEAAERETVRLRSRTLLAAGVVLGLIVLAVILRLVPIIFDPSLSWGDEVFQAIEPAHRLVYGYGMVPWEFQLGMRFWLLPGAVAGLMELARFLGDGPNFYLPMIAVGFSLLASAPVICCFLWCYRWFGLTGASVAGFAVAVAPELVYFGGRTLSGVVAAHILIIAFYLIEPGYPVDSRRRLYTAGALLGVVCLLRLQLTPMVAVIGVWSIRGGWQQRMPWLAAGGLAALALGGLLDWMTLGYPYASVWRNLLYNLYYGVSSEISTEPALYYLRGEFGVWLYASALLVPVVWLGARRLPALLTAAVVSVAVLSMIPHKEYRFIYPAILVLMTLAAIGLAELVHEAEWRLRTHGVHGGTAQAASIVLISGCWGAIALSVWTGGTLGSMRQWDHDQLIAINFARDMPPPCGIGLYGGKDVWVRYGGYSHLHRRVPLFWNDDKAELIAAAPAFNVLLSKKPLPPQLGFHRVQCFGNVCVARRPGGCTARPATPMWFPGNLRALAPDPQRFKSLP